MPVLSIAPPLRCVLLLVVLLMAGCVSNRDHKTPVEQTPAIEDARQTAPKVRPDPGPTLQRRSGTWKASAVTQADAKVVASFSDKTHTWLKVRISAPTRVGIQPPLIKADRHAIAAIVYPSGSIGSLSDASEVDVLIRFVGATDPGPFEVILTGFKGEDEGGFRQASRVDGGKAAKDKLLPAQFLEAAAVQLRNGGNFWGTASTFNAFAGSRLELMASGKPGAPPRERPVRRTDIEEMMDLYTGMTSVEEALQADRGLLLREDAQPKTIPLSNIQGVPLPSHPWPKMIQEIKTDKGTVIEPLAAVVPSDMLYLHFHDLRTFVSLVRDLDEWLSPIGMAIESKPGASHFADRIERQLVVERTILSEKFGHLAVHGFALATSDPFLREGGDATLIFHLKNETMIMGALQSFETAARGARSDIKETTTTIDGVTVRALTTPDGTVSQHRAKMGEVLFVSNSAGAIARFIAVHKGKAQALKDSGDFQYMRTKYPFGADTEDGFAFVSDAFVAAAVGPRLKILSSRRAQARADLQAINSAALLHGWLEGAPPADAKTMIAAGTLRKEELAHADGTPITFSPQTGARSAYGTITGMAPFIDSKIDKVTEAEHNAYKRFVETYQSYWRGFIDPIAVRLKRSEDGRDMDIEALMLPLIDGTDYSDLRRQVGESTTAMPMAAEGLHWTLAVGQDSGLRRMVDSMAYEFTRSDDIKLTWLGDWVMVGVGDRSGLYDLFLAEGSDAANPGDRPSFEALLARFPIFVGAHIGNKLGMAAALTAVRAYVEGSAPGLVAWETGEPYRDIPVTVIRETTAVRSERDPVQISYAIAGDVFLASLERETLEAQMDAVLDNANPKEALQIQAAIVLEPASADGYLIQTILAAFEDQIGRNTVAAAEDFAALHHGLGGLPSDPAARRQLALTWLGYEPMLAHGGTFEMTADGVVSHSIYGDILNPSIPQIPVDGSPVSKTLKTLEALKMGLSFDGKDEHVGLRANVVIRRR